MSKLKAIPPKQAKPSKPKILIYGKPGAGKTWVSLDFPTCYYMDTEGGATQDHYTDKLKASGGSYLGIEQGSMDLNTIIDQTKALGTEDHDYKTLVIDSVSKVFGSTIADEAERLGDKNQYGADKKPAVAGMRRLVRWLTKMDMNVILVAHEKTEWALNDKKERVEIGSTFDCWDKLEYELDLCLHIKKNGPQHMAYVRKSRLKDFPVGTTFEWSYDKFAEKYGREIIESKAQAIVLATNEQLKELEHLFKTVKLEDGQEDKWLKQGNAEGWEDVSTDYAAAVIKHIKNKYLQPVEETK